MSEVSFKFEDVKEKPHRRYRKGSKYDPVLDKFLEGKAKLVKVEVPGKDANYIRTQLKKRIDARGCGGEAEASVVNNVAYLEKL